MLLLSFVTLQWRHNERDSVSNHQPHDCLLNRLFRRRSKKTSKLRVTGLSPHKWPVTRKMFPFDDVIMMKAHPLRWNSLWESVVSGCFVWKPVIKTKWYLLFNISQLSVVNFWVVEIRTCKFGLVCKLQFLIKYTNVSRYYKRVFSRQWEQNSHIGILWLSDATWWYRSG